MPILLPFRAAWPGSDSIYVPGEEPPRPLSVARFHEDDLTPALYLYQQEFGDNRRDGVMGLLNRAEATAFPHEQTCPERVARCLQSPDPGSLWLWCHDADQMLAPLLHPYGAPLREEKDRFGVTHRIWRVSDPAPLQTALRAKELFLADGHHRFAAGWNFATIQIRTGALRTRTKHDIDELERNARRGLLLPPKTTDFWPKLAAGLIKVNMQRV